MEKFKITKEGYAKLQAQIANLKDERPKIIEQIAQARDHGDLKENAEYHAAREKQGIIEATLADLESKFSRAEVVDIASLSGKEVQFGAIVKLENLDNSKIVSYKIVSEFESNIDENLISDKSPVARAIIGKTIGDQVEIATPGGVVDYEIIDVKF